MSAAVPLTEASLIQAIATVGAVLVALIGLVGTWLTVAIGRSRKASEAAVHELRPNGGNSAFDKLSRRLDRVDQKLDADNERIARMEARVDEHIQQSALLVRALMHKESP